VYSKVTAEIANDVQAARNAAALRTPPFTATQLQDHIAAVKTRAITDRMELIVNRFGYGLASAEPNLNFNLPTEANLKKLLFSLTKSIETPRPFLNAELNRLAAQHSFVTPHFGVSFNPLTTSPAALYKLHYELNQKRIRVEVGEFCHDGIDNDGDVLIDFRDTDCSAWREAGDVRCVDTKDNDGDGKIDAADPDCVAFDARSKRDMAYLRGTTRDIAARFRVLVSVFGSQTGGLSDEQVSLPALLEEFWFNHFNVDYTKVLLDASFGPGGYERTIHDKMTTTFYELLSSVIRHPTMLRYLDNHTNVFSSQTGRASNENLGRELLELHAFGKGSGEGTGALYTKEDVQGSALLLTGLNVTNGLVDNQFTYGTRINASRHVPDFYKPEGSLSSVQSAPVVMGRRYCLTTPQAIGASEECPKPAPGTSARTEENINRQLDAYLHDLANHWRTKRNICTKLVRRFVGTDYMASGLLDDPLTSIDESKIEIQRTIVVDRCVAAWGRDGELKKMYEAILRSPELWSKTNLRKLRKNPLDLVVSAARASGIVTSDFRIAAEIQAVEKTLHTEIGRLGLPYRKWTTPTGYNEMGGWIGQGYFVRWIQSSFNIANYMETRSKTGSEYYTPLMGVKTNGSLTGSYEEAARRMPLGKDRYAFVQMLLGMGAVRLEGAKVYDLMSAYLADESKLVKQKINGSPVGVPVKTGLILRTASYRFTQK
jgi:hypothetical protein